MNIVGEITKNECCGMGGDASFLEKDMMDDLTEQLDELQELYENGGAVDPSKPNNRLPEKEKEDTEE